MRNDPPRVHVGQPTFDLVNDIEMIEHIFERAVIG
jgi:hypothetical protein